MLTTLLSQPMPFWRYRRFTRGLAKATCFAAGLGLVPTAGLLSADEAFAQVAIDAGNKARVSRSAGLRAYTERIAAAGCKIEAGIDADAAIEDMEGARYEFDQVLDALINGNATLGMPGAEIRGRTIAALTETKTLWDPFNAAATALIDGSGGAADAQVLRDTHEALFVQSDSLASVISGQYSDSQTLLKSDATIMNFVVRQRALVYRMSRNVCELASGTGTDTTLDELTTTASIFEQTLAALRSGMPAAGINPPPNERVAETLAQAAATWQTGKIVVDAVIAGTQPGPEDVITMVELAEDLSADMDNAITLYLLATPGRDDIFRRAVEYYARSELLDWMTYAPLIDAVNAQNADKANMTEEEILALDAQWAVEAAGGEGDLISGLLAHPVSEWLGVEKAATAGLVKQVFVIDNKGMNVAQSIETEDYWQGDEIEWQSTYPRGSEGFYIGPLEFNNQTGAYQARVAKTLVDPATGEAIGTVVFGVNVQSLI